MSGNDERGPRACVAALVTNPENRVLLIKHRKRGGWELPGGKIETGQTWQQAAIDEVRQEAGLDIVAPEECHSLLNGMPVYEGQYYSVIAVVRATAQGDPVAGDDAEDARWYAASDIPWNELSPIESATALRAWADAFLLIANDSRIVLGPLPPARTKETRIIGMAHIPTTWDVWAPCVAAFPDGGSVRLPVGTKIESETARREPTPEENFAALKRMYPRLAAVYERAAEKHGVDPWDVSEEAAWEECPALRPVKP